MISNLNVAHSLRKGRNLFANSYFRQNVEGNANIHVDVHPTYGYVEHDDSPRYIWSYGFYLANPFMFERYRLSNSTTTSEEPPSSKGGSTSYILYYIVYEQDPSDLVYIETLRSKLRSDIAVLRSRFDANIIVCSWCECALLEAEFPLVDSSDLRRLIRSSSFVVCNARSQLFWLAYECDRTVSCLNEEDPYMLYGSFFLEIDRFEERNKVLSNIRKYRNFMESHFVVSDPDRVGLACFANSYFKEMAKISQIPRVGGVSTLSEEVPKIFLHPQIAQLYNVAKLGLEKCEGCYESILPTSETHTCIYMTENALSKRILGSFSGLIAFDDNVFKMNESKGLFYRYYVNSFDTPLMEQGHDTRVFFYDSNIRYDESGLILCVLDNSGGLFYDKREDWYLTWNLIFEYIVSTYGQSKVLVKPHPNEGDREMPESLCTKHGLMLTDRNIDEVLETESMRFCVLEHGSTHVKCVQHGVLAKSARPSPKRGTFDLFTENVSDQVLEYSVCRKKIFERLLNSVVSIESIASGVFFEGVASILQSS